MRLIDADALIDALHTWFRDGFDEDKWWNSTHVLAAIEGLPSAQQGYKWETCFDCPLSHGCPKIKGCTNEQANEYASQIPNDCPLSAQPDHNADIGKKVSIPCAHENDLISRQEAIDALDKRFDGVPMELTTEILELRRDLRERIPSAQPDHVADVSKKAEVIRCKDCKHWDGVDTCDVIDAPVWDNDFCSMAERRSDE